MDYSSGIELIKYQWDVLHDPQIRLFDFMQKEGEGALKKEEEQYVTYTAYPPKYPGRYEAHREQTEGIMSTATQYGSYSSKYTQPWRWHYDRNYKYLKKTTGKWYKEDAYCKLDAVVGVAAALIVLEDYSSNFGLGRYDKSTIESQIYKVSNFFDKKDDVKGFMKVIKKYPDKVKYRAFHLQIATGRITSENFFFDLFSFVTPGGIIKGGATIVKAIFTKNVVKNIRNLTAGVAFKFSVEGTIIHNTDDIVRHALQGNEILLNESGKEIARFTQGVLKPINYAEKGVKVISQKSLSIIDDLAGKGTVKVLQLVQTETGEWLFKRSSTVAGKVGSELADAGGKLGKVTKTIAKQELPTDYISVLKKFGQKEDDILEYFTKYHNDNGFKFFNEVEDLIKKYPNLNKTDVNLLWGYTTNMFYENLNLWLRKSINASKTKTLKNLLNNSLTKMKTFNKYFIYRGIGRSGNPKVYLYLYTPNSTHTWHAFTSCGSSIEASFIAKSDVIFKIKHLDAKDISDFADGIKFRGYPPHELLIKSGAEFKVISNTKIDKLTGKPIIELIQIK